MARKKKKVEEKEIIYAPIDEQPITETLEQNYMPYAMSVIVSRAIPEIDGLKPAHRKLLYTMYTMGLLGGKLTKSANVVGQTMKLNPHGAKVPRYRVSNVPLFHIWHCHREGLISLPTMAENIWKCLTYHKG